MIWICTGVVFSLVATGTGIRSCDVVAVVAGVAISRNRNMRSGEWVNGAVVKRRRRPGTFTVAAFTIGRELVGGVIGISRRKVVWLVASCAGIGRIGVIAVVTCRTIVGNGSMRAIKWVIIVVNRKSSRRPTRGGRMTRSAIV